MSDYGFEEEELSDEAPESSFAEYDPTGDMTPDDVGEQVPEPVEEDDDIGEMTADELERARSAIRDSQVSADKLMHASKTLEGLVFGVTRDDENSLTSTEFEIVDARSKLQIHRLFGARKSIRRAEKNLKLLEKDIMELRRNIAMLNRLLQEKTINEAEIATILRSLHTATGAAEHGEVGQAAFEVEHLIEGLVENDRSALNPFFFRHFWMGIDTRWPAGSDNGILMLRIVNDGERPIPEMRLEPPVPRGWKSEPAFIDVPAIRPGGFLPVRFSLIPDEPLSSGERPLYRKLSIQTGYDMRAGDIDCVIRVQNRSMANLNDIMIMPWMPPGFTIAAAPVIRRLEPDEIGVIRIPLQIEMGDGGDF